ncbi:hypothetical protein [Luteococcus peritonei]|uniref:MFS transporter n=1 Tax=Luteococcus peritonei TaxID=88874 RepID=A0ABW4RRF6_9ACTN
MRRVDHAQRVHPTAILLLGAGIVLAMGASFALLQPHRSRLPISAGLPLALVGIALTLVVLIRWGHFWLRHYVWGVLGGTAALVVAVTAGVLVNAPLVVLPRRTMLVGSLAGTTGCGLGLGLLGLFEADREMRHHLWWVGAFIVLLPGLVLVLG